MKRALLLAGTSALVGGVAGATASSWLAVGQTEPGAPRTSGSDDGVAPERAAVDSSLLQRVESVEQALRALQGRRTGSEPRARAAETGLAQADAVLDQSRAAAPIDDPVFEAAVLDVLERAEEDRDSERDVKRADRGRQRAEHWANELATRLALSPEQSAKILQIQTQLISDLRERRRSAPTEPYVPREERRAATRALREGAEQQLRQTLDARQVAQYDQLEGELKLVRPPTRTSVAPHK